MGREVRRVPPDWEHPKDERGRYKPMYDASFKESMTQWYEEWQLWEKGEHPDQIGNNGAQSLVESYGEEVTSYWDWEGGPPDPESYMPDWPDEERTHYQMYEDTTEGTPISPVFATPEELAHWLADTGASAFAGMPATYEQWLRVCKGGWAPSMAITAGGTMLSGVEALADRCRGKP